MVFCHFFNTIINKNKQKKNLRHKIKVEQFWKLSRDTIAYLLALTRCCIHSHTTNDKNSNYINSQPASQPSIYLYLCVLLIHIDRSFDRFIHLFTHSLISGSFLPCIRSFDWSFDSLHFVTFDHPIGTDQFVWYFVFY